MSGPAAPRTATHDRTERRPASKHLTNHLTNRSTTMNRLYEDLARAQMSARLGEAHARQRGHSLAIARRLSRRAERAAREARLALARSL